MIGQKRVLEQVDNLIAKGFPRFTIITGSKGQGKKLLASIIGIKLKTTIISFGTKIDEIRDIIELSYKQTEPTLYIIADADKMSLGAKNSLLKVIEEPPQKAYFIMTLQQLENTLDTIKSRCQEIKMQSYSESEIEEMISVLNPKLDDDNLKILKQSAHNYYQLETLIKYNPLEFYNYVEKVYDNIYKVQSANSFKLAEKLDIKGEGNGYDLELFFDMYEYIAIGDIFNCYFDNDFNTAEIIEKCITITDKYENKLGINGINKQSLIDMWILDIRKEWLNGIKESSR